jgi:hypothetical protein
MPNTNKFVNTVNVRWQVNGALQMKQYSEIRLEDLCLYSFLVAQGVTVNKFTETNRY